MSEKVKVVATDGTIKEMDKEKLGDISQYPNCPSELCAKVRLQIQEYCKQLGWPPDTPVLVLNPDTGEICLCYCS